MTRNEKKAVIESMAEEVLQELEKSFCNTKIGRAHV